MLPRDCIYLKPAQCASVASDCATSDGGSEAAAAAGAEAIGAERGVPHAVQNAAAPALCSVHEAHVHGNGAPTGTTKAGAGGGGSATGCW